jgi:hypothetical protein
VQDYENNFTQRDKVNIGDFYAKTALSYGHCEIEKGVMLYSPAGIKALIVDDEFDHTEADYWITTGGFLIPMYGTENITDFLNEQKEKGGGIVIPVDFKTGRRNDSGLHN